MAQQASTSIISYRPLCLVKPFFFWQGSYCSARLPIEKTTSPSTTTQHHLATITEHGTHNSALRSEPQAFGLLVFFNKLVTASQFRLYLLHLFFKALLHINHIFIIYTFITAPPPPPGVTGVNEVTPPGYCFHCFL